MSGKTETRLLVSIETRKYNDLAIDVIARPVHIVTENGTERVRNISMSGFDCDPLADLQVRCYVGTDDDWFGYSTEYRDVFSVDEARAAAMTKQLGKVRRGMEKLESELGFAESFPAYLARVAKVLGITRFGFKASGDSGWHDGNEYRWVDATYLKDYITSRVTDAQKTR